MTSAVPNRPRRETDDIVARIRELQPKARLSQDEITSLQAEIDTIDGQIDAEHAELKDKLETLVDAVNMVQEEHDEEVEKLEAQRSEKIARLNELTGTPTPPAPITEPTPPTRISHDRDRDRTPGTQRRTGSEGRPVTSPARKKSNRQRINKKLSGTMEAVVQISNKAFIITGALIGLWLFFSFNHDDSLGDGAAYRVLPFYLLIFGLIGFGFGWAIKRYFRKELENQKGSTDPGARQHH